MTNYIQKNLRLILEGRYNNQEMVDAILDKVSSQGMESLTPEEKHILQNPDEVPEPYDKDKSDREIIDYVFGKDEDEGPDEGDPWEMYELDPEEEQEDQILMALSQLKFEYGTNLRRKRAKAIDEDNNEYYYIQFIDGNGNHIMDLEERVYIKHGGGEEAVSILKVDNNLYIDLFTEFEVEDENKIKVFQKYLGEMFGYDIEEVISTKLNKI